MDNVKGEGSVPYYQDDDFRLWAKSPNSGSLSCGDVDPSGRSQHDPGAKLDGSKPDASLLQFFARALIEVARVGTYGAKKYTRGGWVEVPDGRQRYTAAMLRHLLKETIEGVYDTDPDLARYGYQDQIRHDAQVAWNALARLELALREGE
jgi:hypothetical protein